MNNIMVKINKGEVYYTLLESKDNVQGGIRPSIVVSVNGSVVTVIPLTSKLKRGDLLSHVFIKTIDKRGQEHDSNCLIEQIQTIPKGNIMYHYGTIPQEDRQKINSRLNRLITV